MFLLNSQSQLLSNLNSVISSLNNIETILASETHNLNVFDLILESLRLVAPYHEVEFIVPSQGGYEDIKNHKHVTFLDDLWRANDIYRSVFTMNQPFTIEDIQMVPAWKGIHAPSKTHSWMGIPFADQNGMIGLLALSRFNVSPFNNNEKEMAQVFARYINTFLGNLSQQVERNYSYSKLY